MKWTRVCAANEVPKGTLRGFTVGGISLIVVMGENGVLVIPPSCPHMSNALADGFFDGHVLTCNKHLWQWRVPEGEAMGVAEQGLLRYPTQMRDDGIWVDLEQELRYDHEQECSAYAPDTDR